MPSSGSSRASSSSGTACRSSSASRPPGVPAFIIWIAGPIELLGGFLVMIGLFTRWAAFLASGLMAFAYWMGHGTKALLPVVNQGELAVLYCFVFLFIAARGPGIWSVERGG
jgi:putative oxidoreductase